MGQYSIGEALSLLLEKSQWKQKVHELRLRQDWETIVGKTVARYTRDMQLRGQSLTIFTDVAPLKHELALGKAQLIIKINEHFGEKVVADILVK